MAKNTGNAENQQVSSKKRVIGRPFKKGQSGNPKGRPTDPKRKEAMELLKLNAPEITEKAINMVLCDEPNIQIMTALIKKIFPDNINLAAEINLKSLSNEQLTARFIELVRPLNLIGGNPDPDRT